MRLIRAFAITVTCLAIAAAQANIPANAYLIRVLVTDKLGHPLPGAEVRLGSTPIGVTDETGYYYLFRKPLPAGPHALSVSLRGFTTASRQVLLPVDEQAAGLEMTIELAAEDTAKKSVSMGITDNLRGSATARDPNYEIIQIFYATDRQDTGSPNPVTRYANQRSQPGVLERGTCDVSIPRDHRLGSLEGPSLLRLEYLPDPDKHVVLRSVDPLQPDPFYQKLRTKIERSSRREAVVFIHGYNTGFEEAARRTAQLAYDVGFDGAPILYSWPSRNKLLAYTEDEDTVQWTAFHLRGFLKELAERSSATKIHVIAHSMGNRALAAALQVIAAERREVNTPLFRQIVLAAPDIGADTVELLAREIQPLARRITLYASAYDDALMFSRLLHGVLRAGEKGGHLMVVPGIDTVDASAVRTDFLGHSYYGHSDSIVADIRQILTTEAPPEKRKLLPSLFEKLQYWIVPPPKTGPALSIMTPVK